MSITLLPCRVCGDHLPPSAFSPSEVKAWNGRRRPRCRVCDRERVRRYNEKHADEIRERRKTHRLKPRPHRPSGQMVDCMVCGATFTRDARRTSACCSTECSTEARRERYRRKNRARKIRRSPGAYTLRDIATRDGARCHLCGKPVDMTLSGMSELGPTIDHLIPLSAGGEDTARNVALAHRRCNVARGVGGAVQLRLTG